MLESAVSASQDRRQLIKKRLEILTEITEASQRVKEHQRTSKNINNWATVGRCKHYRSQTYPWVRTPRAAAFSAAWQKLSPYSCMQCTYSLDIHLRSLPTKPVGIRLIDARTGETSDNQEDLTIVLRACQMPYNMGHTHTHTLHVQSSTRTVASSCLIQQTEWNKQWIVVHFLVLFNQMLHCWWFFGVCVCVNHLKKLKLLTWWSFGSLFQFLSSSTFNCRGAISCLQLIAQWRGLHSWLIWLWDAGVTYLLFQPHFLQNFACREWRPAKPRTGLSKFPTFLTHYIAQLPFTCWPLLVAAAGPPPCLVLGPTS